MKKIILLYAALFSLTTTFAQTDDFVHKSGDEAITGYKTFDAGITVKGPVYLPWRSSSTVGTYRLITINKNSGVVETIDPTALANGGTFDDSDILHKSLQETITGPKYFNSNLYTQAGIIVNGPMYMPWRHSSTAGNYNIITINKANNMIEIIDPATLGVGGVSADAALKTANETVSGSWNFTNNIGIGIANPTDKLAVNGRIRAKEIKVETANFPDYVFRNDYPLLSLSDLEKFIKANNHLPEVPSAAEAEKNGVDLGEMNKILLKKIEELTLHLIEQNKVLLDQTQKIGEQSSELKEMKEQVEYLKNKLQ
ncbi:hypothetical protein [Rubrolithibacter danxiaensis]|uniref:hypothetical protein n=1 Tax=Rubrolithibacter danxiaensis TaxID=3390805 RepID=UPI003BF87984